MTAKQRIIQFSNEILCFCRRHLKEGVDRRLVIEGEFALAIFDDDNEDGDNGDTTNNTTVININPSKRINGGA